MAAVQQRAPSFLLTLVKNQHQRHRASEKSSTVQSFSSQAQIHAHQPLPPLLHQPQICHPLPVNFTTLPSTSTTSTSDAIPTSSFSKGRRKNSSATPFDVLRLMDSLHFPVEADTYASLLQECARSGNILQGAAIHTHIRRRFSVGRFLLPQPDTIGIANRLLLMYAFCGRAMDARQVFDNMRVRDSMSRIITITALSDVNDDLEALRLFVSMHAGNEDWWALNPLGFRVVLWSCARACKLGLGCQLHGLAFKLTGCSSFTEHTAPLIYFYAKLNCPDLSLQLMMSAPPSYTEESTWASIVSAYCKTGCFKKALMVFKEMERRRRRRRRIEGYKKRKRKRCKLLASIIAACAAKEGFEEGYQIHSHAVKVGADEDGYVGCSLVELYSKRGTLLDARRAFETIVEEGRDSACWNAMLSGYARRGSDEEKFRFLQEMMEAGIKPIEAILNQVW